MGENPFQNVSFRTVGEMLDYLPENELAITLALRSIIFNTLPEVTEKLSYNVPFYYGRSRICYLWPGSIPWGKKLKSGVEMGLCKGNLLEDPSSGFDLGNRKEVSMRSFQSIRDIHADEIKSLLIQALEIDEKIFQGRKKR